MAASKNLFIKLLIDAKDNASGVIQSVARKFDSLKGSIAAIGAAVTAGFGSVFGVALATSAKAAEALDVQMRKLQGVIDATGSAAGLTAKELDDMARRLDEATLGSAAGFRDAAAKLLTFKAVGKDVFERTLMLSQDLASDGFGSVESAAVMLGKALQDPVSGVTALKRAGVDLTAAQKELVKSLAETGRIAEAQQVILQEVESQVGGVASAMGGGLSGAVDLVGKRLTDLKEQFGAGVGPALTDVNNKLAEFYGQLTQSGMLERFGEAVGRSAEQFKEMASQAGDAAIGMAKLVDAITRPGQTVSAAGAAFEKTFSTLKQYATLGPIVGAVKASGDSFGGLGNIVRTAEEKLATFILHWKGIYPELEATGDAADEVAPKVKSLADVMAEIGPKAGDSSTRVAELDAKLKALGVTVEQLNSTAPTALEAFDALIRSDDVSSGGLLKGLSAAVSKVSAEDLPALGRAWETAKVAGRITAEEYQQGLAAIDAKIKSLPPAVGSLEAAYAQLGVTSQSALDQTAAKAQEAFAVLAKGNQPLERLQAGFDAYAQAATAANGGVVPSAVKAAAAMHGLTLIVDKSTGGIGRAADNTSKLAGALDKSSKSASAQNEALSKGAQMLTDYQAKSAAEAAEIAKNNAIKAASYEQVNKAQITYGEWVEKSGAQAAAQIDTQRALAVEIGHQAEVIKDLSREYQDAVNYNEKFSKNGIDVSGAEALSRHLEDAKKGAERLKGELADITDQPIKPQVDESQLDAVIKKSESLDGVTTYSDHVVEDNVLEVLSDLETLQNKDTSSTHTVYVREVQTNNAGGLVLRRATGGPVFRPLRGSTVPGVGDHDSVPAALPAGAFVLRKAASRRYARLIDTLLTPGERIIPPDRVAALGLGFLQRLNNLQVPAFNAGGLVGGGSGAASADTLNINLQVGKTPVVLQGARDQAQTLARALRDLERGL